MRQFILLTIVLLSAAEPCIAQRSPDVEAFLDALTAKSIPQVAKHLPPVTQKHIAELSAEEQKSLESTLLVFRNLEKEGSTVTIPGEGPVLMKVSNLEKQDDNGEIVLDRYISDGYQSLLQMGFRTRPDQSRREASIYAWMRYEEGEWRVFELQLSDHDIVINLEDSMFFGGRDVQSDSNERSAVSLLRSYGSALLQYQNAYPDIGLPNSLEVLRSEEGSENTPEHAGLLDAALCTPPLEKNGYTFTYRPAGANQYTIIARPTDFGRSGTRNFFFDQTATVRYTLEDREPSRYDPEYR